MTRKNLPKMKANPINNWIRDKVNRLARTRKDENKGRKRGSTKTGHERLSLGLDPQSSPFVSFNKQFNLQKSPVPVAAPVATPRPLSLGLDRKSPPGRFESFVEKYGLERPTLHSPIMDRGRPVKRAPPGPRGFFQMTQPARMTSQMRQGPSVQERSSESNRLCSPLCQAPQRVEFWDNNKLYKPKSPRSSSLKAHYANSIQSMLEKVENSSRSSDCSRSSSWTTIYSVPTTGGQAR